MPLVAGIDTSTQSCKVAVRDLDSGELVRSGRASHPDGTVVDPEAWFEAACAAIDMAGGLRDVVAVSVAGQQHGMVCLDSSGRVVRPAILWNDTESAQSARDLIDELGTSFWIDTTGGLPVASFTVTKLRWLRDHEPENARLTHAVALPHDYVTWRLMGYGPDRPDFSALVTDRSEASGTAYWSPFDDDYRLDILERAFGKHVALPQILGPGAAAGVTGNQLSVAGPGVLFGAGSGDNASAALGLEVRPGDVIASLGTSGAVFSTTEKPTKDPTGTVASFADAAGGYLPLVGTISMSKPISAAARILGVDYLALAELALQAPAGSGGVVFLPYLEGERTPNLPHATGSLLGLTVGNTNPAAIARAAIEGVLCNLADGLDAIRTQGVATKRVILIGGVSKSHAVQQVAPGIFGVEIRVPDPSEYVADGAARQASWAYSGKLPAWGLGSGATLQPRDNAYVRQQYREAQKSLGYSPT